MRAALLKRLIDRFGAGRGGLLRDSAIAFFVRGLGAIAMFLMSLVVARALPPKEAGYFFLAVTVITILVPLCLLGTNTASLRFIGAWSAEDDWGRVRSMVRTTRMWAGAALFAGVAVLVLVSPWMAERVFDKPDLGPVLTLMAPSLFLIGGGMLVAYQLQAIRKVSRSIFVLSIGVPAGVALGTWGLGADSAAEVGVLYVAAALLTLIVGLYWWTRAVPTVSQVPIENTTLWASCSPLWITEMMAIGAAWGSPFVAGIWVSAEEVAHLSVAQRTANLVSFILIAVNLVVAPRFAALYQQSRHEELRALALRSVRLMILVAAPVVLLLCVFPQTVMSVFGPEFRAAAPLLVIMALGQFVNVMTGSVGFLLTMSGHERDMRNIVLFSGPFAVAAAFLLTPLYGALGAAVATALAVSVQNLGAVWWVRKRLGFNTLAIWKRV